MQIDYFALRNFFARGQYLFLKKPLSQVNHYWVFYSGTAIQGKHKIFSYVKKGWQAKDLKDALA